jgi:ABC-type Fe3+-hydroxamate transport system substrate-binding protein
MVKYLSPLMWTMLAVISIGLIWRVTVQERVLHKNSWVESTVLLNEDDKNHTIISQKMIDPAGRVHLFNDAPQRIVSLTLATDEILSELVDHSTIKGITQWADDADSSNVAPSLTPQWSLSKLSTSKLSTSQSLIPAHRDPLNAHLSTRNILLVNPYSETIVRLNGHIENVLALEPDLVFVAAYTREETVRLLLSLRIPVVQFTHYDSFANIQKNIMTLASVTHTTEKAVSLLAQLNAHHQWVEQKIKHKPVPRVLYYSLYGGSAGKNTLMDEMITLAGGYNVLRDTGIQGYQTISEEMAIGLQPDVVLMGGWSPSQAQRRLYIPPAQKILKKSSWQHTYAVLNQKVYDLKGRWVSSVSQYSWHGVEFIARILHPEAFDTQPKSIELSPK